MDLKTANTAIDVAIKTANGLGVKFCIAVMDSGVNLVAFSRMDGGRVGTIDVAMKKVTKERSQVYSLLFNSRLKLPPCLFLNRVTLERRHFLDNLSMGWSILMGVSSPSQGEFLSGEF